MPQYFFILGKNSVLSLAELLTVFLQEQKKYTLKASQPEFAIFDFPQDIDAPALMRCLGGTIKIGRIIDEIKKPKLENVENLCHAALISQDNKRLPFGFSIYSPQSKI